VTGREEEPRPRRVPSKRRRRGATVEAAAPPVEASATAPATVAGLPARRWQQATLVLLAAWFGAQLLLPFRHNLYPGDVAWTEEGHRFSWRMKLRDKAADTLFFATDPATGETWEVNPFDHLSELQYDEMSGRPDMILQAAHYIADVLRAEGYDQIEVRAEASASLNGREFQDLIDPTVNLASQPRDIWPAAWIVPFEDSPPGVQAVTDPSNPE
jgi:vitamin K-dependent gamma-carboxylase